MTILHTGKNTKIYPGAKIIAAKFSIGDNAIIDDFVLITSDSLIGDHVHIGAFTSVLGRGFFVMAPFSGLSTGVRVFTSHDEFKGGGLTNPTIPAKFRAPPMEPVDPLVVIGEHAIVGANSVILSGSAIGDGAVVGANSLVKGFLEPWTVNAGNPTRVVGRRDEKSVREMQARLMAWKQRVQMGEEGRGKETMECPECAGEGELGVGGSGEFPLYQKCQRCGGRGEVVR